MIILVDVYFLLKQIFFERKDAFTDLAIKVF